jgi:hypothetical protein
MYAMYFASVLQYWQLVRIPVRTNHPCLRVGCHNSYCYMKIPYFSAHALNISSKIWLVLSICPSVCG